MRTFEGSTTHTSKHREKRREFERKKKERSERMPAKVAPLQHEKGSKRQKQKKVMLIEKMYVMLLHVLFQLCGGQRHPKVPSFEDSMDDGALTEYKYVPPDSTIIYISHEWVGTNHPDPRGDQIYHLLLLLERLQRGDVSRTDMDVMHSLVYKHKHTTTAQDWQRILDPKKIFIFYDGFCVPTDKREEGFRMIPEFIERCDFMFILAPGCTHVDKIDPRTRRKMNLVGTSPYSEARFHGKWVFYVS